MKNCLSPYFPNFVKLKIIYLLNCKSPRDIVAKVRTLIIPPCPAGVISTGLDQQKVGRKLPVEPKTANRVNVEAGLKELDRY